jgi:dsRNA-specific ribonuclease
MGMTVEIDLDDEVKAGQNMREAIIESAARKLVAAMGEELQDNLRELIRPRLEPIVEAALAGPIQPTDSFGNAKGKPTTLVELIMQTVTDALTKKVYDSGRPEHERETLIEKLVREAVGYQFRSDLKSAMDVAKSAALASVSEVVSEVVTQVLGDRVLKTTP